MGFPLVAGVPVAQATAVNDTEPAVLTVHDVLEPLGSTADDNSQREHLIWGAAFLLAVVAVAIVINVTLHFVGWQ